ncbi:MAG: penicillin acylase family protein [Cyclobacteriaceae bacterium]|nr:penicillin acylase family protein [Cyclobacteriaceae bacterium]
MKLFKSVSALILTVLLIVALNRSWNFGSPIPPLGKFLNPFGGFWQNAERKEIPDEAVRINGLKGEIQIIYDSLLIPHVFASNDEDLYLAQGFVTARHRLWQMEFQTHAAAGRVSEIIGKAALDYDRTQRRRGMVWAAEKAKLAMEANPVANTMVTNYTKGVNQYIQSLTYKNLPLEYKLLDYEPEEWTTLKCALLLKNMALTLNSGEKDFEMTNALNLFDKTTLDLLWPDNENVGDPIVDNTGNWKFNPIVLDSIPLAVPKELIAISALEKAQPDVGSNNWAVSGKKTHSGAPILCNDPHLGLTLPSIWFIIHLQAPGVNVMGASLPGAPAVISGFTDSIAWGVTNAQRDLVDWYKVEFKDALQREYKVDSAWRPTHQLVEKIAIKNSAPFYDTVTYTHHGPVMFDRLFNAEGEKNNFSLRWVAHDPSEEVVTFYKLNRAKNFSEYMEALDHYASPAQNFAFASVSGDIAMRIQGKYPVRRKDEGRFVLDGTNTQTEWKAFIPNEQNIVHKNPPRGFVSSANQYPADTSYPYYITASSYEAYRNRRINKLLSEMTEITPRDMMELQFDSYNLKASETLPLFLSFIKIQELTESQNLAYSILKDWDYENTTDALGASYYEAWWNALMPLVWDEIKEAKVALQYPTAFTTIKLIKEKPELNFFDILTTPEKETARDVVHQAFLKGVAAVDSWKAEHNQEPRWADYKDTYIEHLLRLPAMSYHVQHGGNREIVNASSRKHGPSWRMVVSLEKNGVRAWGVYPGGQSGNPGSPYYNNMLNSWTQGSYYTLQFDSNPTRYKAVLANLTLQPE